MYTVHFKIDVSKVNISTLTTTDALASAIYEETGDAALTRRMSFLNDLMAKISSELTNQGIEHDPNIGLHLITKIADITFSTEKENLKVTEIAKKHLKGIAYTLIAKSAT